MFAEPILFVVQNVSVFAHGPVLVPIAFFVDYPGLADWIVLVDSANRSATFPFAQLMQSKHLAMLVGEPTGGNQRRINGGTFFFLTLPKTKIEFDLARIGAYPTKPMPDGGILPDLLVAPKAAVIDAGYDSALDTARALLADR